MEREESQKTPASQPADGRQPATLPPVRIAHFSDVHVTVRPLGWRWADFFNKRLSGRINASRFARGRRFRHADAVVAALLAEVRRRRPDCLVFSGDATVLGFEAEVRRAATLLGVADPAMPPGLAVPGNHDYYTRGAAASGFFERHFGPWLAGQRVDGAVYPFAQRVGPLWLIGVNSSRGNFWPWDATGVVGKDQLARLERLLASLDGGLRVMVTHYPVCLPGGLPEKRDHGLADLADLLAVCKAGGVSLWLHGHRHEAYHVDDPGIAPFPVICAGSATQTGRWGYNAYTIVGHRLEAVRRVFSIDRNAFVDAEPFAVELPVRT